MRPVRTKADFVKRYAAGEFGNRPETWPTVQDWVSAGGPSMRGTYHLRNRIAGGPTYYSLSPQELLAVAEEVGSGGYYVSEMAPHEVTLLQGEVMRGPRGLELLWTTDPQPMRDALRASSQVSYGLVVRQLLEAMDAVSREWLDYLLDAYDGHVVEFSTFGRRCGILGWNTLIWEVRLY